MPFYEEDNFEGSSDCESSSENLNVKPFKNFTLFV